MLTSEWEWSSWLDVWEEESFTDIRFKSPADSLNEDCLRVILLYLPIRDRVRCEGVCKRWRRVSRHIWKLEQKLCIRELRYRWPFPKPFLSVLLWKTGGSLKRLDFSDSKYVPDQRFGKVIASECKNLEELDLTGVNISNAHLKDIAAGVSKLKKFVMDAYINANKGLCAILKANPGLEYLSLGINVIVTSKAFFHISSNLKILRISFTIDDILLRGLRIILKRNPGLEELELQCSLEPAFQLISDACRKLKTLSMNCYWNPTRTGNLGGIACLRQLEKLTLRRYTPLIDDTISVIASSCSKLVEVDLKDCGIHNNSLKWLSYLPSLRCLDVSGSYVGDEGMKVLATRTMLSVFKASRCYDITNEGIVALLESNPNMDMLDVSYCRKVNDDLLTQLSRILSYRTSLGTLLLQALGTDISLKASERMDDNIKVDILASGYKSDSEYDTDGDDYFSDNDLWCDHEVVDYFYDDDSDSDYFNGFC